MSEISVQGDGKPLGEGLLGAVRESRGHGPLDGRHQREASAWIHGYYCFHKKPFIINHNIDWQSSHPDQFRAAIKITIFRWGRLLPASLESSSTTSGFSFVLLVKLIKIVLNPERINITKRHGVKFLLGRYGDRFWYEGGGWPSSFTQEQVQFNHKLISIMQ